MVSAVGSKDYFRSRSSEDEALPPLTLWLEERDWDTEGGDGEHLDGHGFGLRDEDDRALAWDDPILAAGGVLVLKVAGTSHRLSQIQDGRFAPGSSLSLHPDPENQYDDNAVGVWDASGRVQAGFVPADSAEELGQRLKRERLEVFCLWEWRDESGQRCGLRMLIHPPGVGLRRQPKRLR
jgi:hypothetical protein